MDLLQVLMLMLRLEDLIRLTQFTYPACMTTDCYLTHFYFIYCGNNLRLSSLSPEEVLNLKLY